MTREEEILNAAREYTDKVIFASPSTVLYFEAGAKWADKHPKNVWHDASEEPRPNELMLGIDSDGVSLYKWYEQEDSWDSFVTITELSRWAYISDLLPKGGEE